MVAVPSTISLALTRGHGRGKGGSNNGRDRGHIQNASNDQFAYPKPCCRICNRIGHMALDCYRWMDYSFQGRHPCAQLAAMAALFGSPTEQHWYVDLGATNHITNDINNLLVHSGFQGTKHVAIGNSQGLQISNTSSSILQTSHMNSFTLNDILHVPAISSNLLSVRKFSKDNNCMFVFDSDGFSIQDQTIRNIRFRGLSQNGLYPFPLFAAASPSSVINSTTFLGIKTTAGTWHQRLGHPTGSACHKLLVNLPYSGFSSTLFCKFCQMAKSCKLAFPISQFVTNKPLELIHSDVWGPSLSSSCDLKYYAIFIDDFSKYTWFYPLYFKSDVHRYLSLSNCK